MIESSLCLNPGVALTEFTVSAVSGPLNIPAVRLFLRPLSFPFFTHFKYFQQSPLIPASPFLFLADSFSDFSQNIIVEDPLRHRVLRTHLGIGKEAMSRHGPRLRGACILWMQRVLNK